MAESNKDAENAAPGDSRGAMTTTTTAAWRSLDVWERSGFLAFLAAHEIKRSDLLGSDDTNGAATEQMEQRFFRYVRNESV